MRTGRPIIFWMHLVFGVTAGIVILVMSFTGAALALQPQILSWIEQPLREVEVPGDASQRRGPDALLAALRVQKPGATPTVFMLDSDPASAATVTVQPPATWYVDPYTGRVLGDVQQTRARQFFRTMTDWHRWLALQGERRTTGRWITGVCNALFFGLALSGMFLWWPRVWTWASVSAVAFFRRGLSGKPRDFNWHNVIGAWSAPVLVVLTLSGIGISFPKTYDAIYALTGIDRPRSVASPDRDARRVQLGALDPMWAAAERQLPHWKTITMRLPQTAGQPVTVSISHEAPFNAMARSTLTLDPVTGAVLQWEPYDQQPAGQRLRSWMRFGHTGEVFGLAGQLVAGLASAGACVLVWTGAALTLRRFTAWRSRRSRLAAVVEERAA
jgi:uncharacterized iron-regulated membrane protein